MAKQKYRQRIIDRQVRRALAGAGAVVVEGPKACGKTTTAQSLVSSEIHLDDELGLTQGGVSDPYPLLRGATPRLVDEWQLVPQVWNAVRREIDRRGEPGQFVLTGSASPADDVTRHSGAGRFIRIPMRPMSLFELGISDGSVSLKDLWNGTPPEANLQKIPLDQIGLACARGGWPGYLAIPDDIVFDLNRSYIRTIAAADIVTVDGVKRDPSKVSALINSLARNTATYVSQKKLQADSSAFGASIDPKTLTSYLDALSRSWLLVSQPAWGGHLRSSTPARKASKRHLVDPSLAVAAMRSTPADLLSDHAAFGQVFESLVVRDMSIYGQANDLDVMSFHDARDREIDIVLVQGTKWAGVEVKLAAIPAVVNQAAAGLKSIAAEMVSQPQFLAVVTGDGPTYVRDDGVYVISVAHLRD